MDDFSFNREIPQIKHLIRYNSSFRLDGYSSGASSGNSGDPRFLHLIRVPCACSYSEYRS